MSTKYRYIVQPQNRRFPPPIELLARPPRLPSSDCRLELDGKTIRAETDRKLKQAVEERARSRTELGQDARKH